jgi:MFS superfamily sulfate permease-like transporter
VSAAGKGGTSSDEATPTSVLGELRHDIPAGLVVFLVALPLCLGVALASGAPLASGLVAGCVGGLIVPVLSRSAVSVSGPAAGLAALVLTGVEHHGFATVCAATMIAGGLQLVLGALRAGVVVSFIPSTVIRGMLAAIGLLLILKQFPHAIGYDQEAFDSDEFEVAGGGNTFSLLLRALSSLEWGAVIVSVLTVTVVLTQERTRWRKIAWLPAALVVVVAATLVNAAFRAWAPGLSLEARHLVDVPLDASTAIDLVDLEPFTRAETYTLGLVLGIVASLESLLSLDAVDRLDPFKRRSDPNRELLAQGAANLLSGFLGGLPVTSVIVRSSANVNAGGRTRASAFFHGLFLLTAILFLAPLLRQVPLAALASILVLTGLKLASPRTFVAMWNRGKRIFTPFAVTILAILFTDLLRGILVGIFVGLAFTLREAMRNAVEVRDDGGVRIVRFAKDVYFFHKAQVLDALDKAPAGTRLLLVDKGAADFVSEDVREAIADFETLARGRGMALELKGVPRASLMPEAH